MILVVGAEGVALAAELGATFDDSRRGRPIGSGQRPEAKRRVGSSMMLRSHPPYKKKDGVHGNLTPRSKILVVDASWTEPT